MIQTLQGRVMVEVDVAEKSEGGIVIVGGSQTNEWRQGKVVSCGPDVKPQLPIGTVVYFPSIAPEHKYKDKTICWLDAADLIGWEDGL